MMEVDCVRQAMIALPRHTHTHTRTHTCGCNTGAYQRMGLKNMGGVWDTCQHEQQGPCNRTACLHVNLASETKLCGLRPLAEAVAVQPVWM